MRGEGDAIERYLPLYEAKLFHQYDHRFATFEGADERALRGGNAREMTAEEKAAPSNVIIPRYWVPEEEVNKRLASQGAGDISAPPTAQMFGKLAQLARNSLSAGSLGQPTSEPGSAP